MERPPKPTGASSGYPLTSLRLRTTVMIISGEPYNMDLYFGMGQLEDCDENCLCPYSLHQFHHLILASIKAYTLRIKFVTNGKGPRQKVRIFNTFFFPPLLIKHFMGRDAICRHPISESLCHKNCLSLWNREKKQA